jgi:hypothetical protein
MSAAAAVTAISNPHHPNLMRLNRPVPATGVTLCFTAASFVVAVLLSGD